MESRREKAGSTSVLEVQEQITGVPDRKDGSERRNHQRNNIRKCFIIEAHIRIERAH